MSCVISFHDIERFFSLIIFSIQKITQKTVLVLGAGASNAYGFPLGRGLRDLACTPPGDHISEAIKEAGYDLSEMNDFIETLQHFGYTSVDWFLEDRTEFIPIGKAAIAACLIPFENPAKLFPPQATTEHWYELLLNIMASPIEEFCNNELSVITFNYDRSLEYYFLKVLETRLKSLDKAVDLLSTFEIVHVHGSLGELLQVSNTRDYTPEVSSESIKIAADNIIIVGEASDDSQSFEQARVLLNNAERIVFLGFGFHPESVRRLGIFNEPWDEEKRQKIKVGGTSRGMPLHNWNNIQENILNGAFPARARSVHSVYSHLNEQDPLGI